MTDEQIEKLAQRIASILYNRAQADLTFEIPDEVEEDYTIDIDFDCLSFDSFT